VTLHNGAGPVTRNVTLQRDFEIFDSLPACVREALNYSMFKYVAAEVAITVKSFGAERIAAAMPASDQRLLEKERTGANLAKPPPKRGMWDDWQP
jgi:hypothetical protein